MSSRWRSGKNVHLDVELDPEDAHAYISRGLYYGKLGESQNAIADYNKAIELNPEDAWAYHNRGVSHRALGQYTKADADKAKACSLDGQFC